MSATRGCASLALACVLGPMAPLYAQHPLNLGFERDGFVVSNQPWGWRPFSFAPDAAVALDSLVRREGARSLRIDVPPEGADDAATHALMYWVPPLAVRGVQVRLTGWVRLAPPPDGGGDGSGSGGRPSVTLQSWGAGASLADTARTAGAPGDDGWTPLEAEVLVGPAAHSVVVTVGLSGGGSAWFDDFRLDAGGKRLLRPPVAPTPTPEEIAWLDARSHSLGGIEPGAVDDLEAFDRIVGDARLVALGEATHGTSEFFRAKHRLVRHLVERHGFRVFLIEANQLAVERVNEYVKGGAGDAADVMRAMFAVWNTSEVRDLVDWVRARNERHPGRPVEFVGFDMQDPSLPIDSLEVALAALAPDLVADVRGLHADFREAWRASPYPRATDERRRRWVADAEAAWRLVSGARPAMLEAARGAADSMAVAWAVQNANVVLQAARSALTQELSTRDSAMAANVLWTLERRFPGERAALWAHDAHISRGEDGTNDYYGGGSMGAVLSRALGPAYRAVGLLTYRGRYSGYADGGVRDVELFPAPVGSIEEALHRVARARGRSILLADLRDLSPGGRGAWLLEGRPIRLIGFAPEDWGFAYPIAVGRQFDAVLFVDETTPSRPLSRGG